MGDGYNRDTPDFLYHYTSLESLSLILKSKKFLFRRLSDLNDPLEGRNESFDHAEKLVYSSSWTANEDDTLPMWKMYPGFDGVRIRMRSSLFLMGNDGKHGKWPPTKDTLNYADIDPSSVHVHSEEDKTKHPVRMSILSGPDRVKYAPRSEVHAIGDVFWLQEIQPLMCQIRNLYCILPMSG